MQDSTTFSWCHDATLEDTLCQLYLDNVSPDYISHSELQGERAESPGNWRADLPDVIRGEIRAALSHDWAHGDSSLLAVATQDGTIVGMALVSIDTRQRAARSFAALDDLVLHRMRAAMASARSWSSGWRKSCAATASPACSSNAARTT